MFEKWFVFTPAADLMQSAASALLTEHLGTQPKDYERQPFINALKGQGVTEVKGMGLTVEGRRVCHMKGLGAAETWRRPMKVVAAE